MAPPIPYRGPLRVPGVRTCPLGRACGSAATVPLLPTRQVQGLVRRAQLNLPNHPNLFCEGLLRAENLGGLYCFSVRIVQYFRNYLQNAHLNGSARSRLEPPNSSVETVRTTICRRRPPRPDRGDNSPQGRRPGHPSPLGRLWWPCVPPPVPVGLRAATASTRGRSMRGRRAAPRVASLRASGPAPPEVS